VPIESSGWTRGLPGADPTREAGRVGRSGMAVTRRRPLRTRVGAVLLVLGTVQFLVAHLVVQSAWPVPYSWAADYISDLGAVTCTPGVCSPWHAVMNTAFVLQGLLLIGGTLLTAGAWTAGAGRRVWQGLVVAAGVSWVVVGLVPEDVDRTLHAAAALPGFVVSNAALLVAGASTSTRRYPAVHRAATMLGAVGVAGFVLLAVATWWPDGPVAGPDGYKGAAERAVVFPLQIWAVVAGVALTRRARPLPRPSPPSGDGPRSPSRRSRTGPRPCRSPGCPPPASTPRRPA
jgi:hypothetical membrane protein